MTITSRDQLIDAMGNSSSRFILDKASIASQAAGNYVSMWRATGQPGQGAVPTTAAVCTTGLTGAMVFAQQTAPATSYGAYMEVVTSNSTMTVEIHDRIAHMGGLNGTLATAQTVGIDLSTLLSTSNVGVRIGDANYSDVQWWLEWYTATGSTAATATVAATYGDGTSGNLTALSLAATRPASFMVSLNALIPAASSGKYIRAVNTVTLSATTGTAGSFGVTATRIRMASMCPVANLKTISNWADLGFPEIGNSACLFPVVLTGTTSSGTLRGGGKIIHG